jgi:hypothetical protein
MLSTTKPFAAGTLALTGRSASMSSARSGSSLSGYCGKEKALRMQQKIQALEVLSRRCQLLCKKNASDSKQYASTIYKHLLQVRKPWKQVQDGDLRKLCKQIDSHQPLQLGNPAPKEPWMKKKTVETLNMRALNKKPQNNNQEEEEDRMNQQEDAKDLWTAIELARAEEERLQKEHQKKQRDAQRERQKRDLHRQNQEHEASKQKQKQQKEAELKNIMRDVEAYREEERKIVETKQQAEKKLYQDLVQQKEAFRWKAKEQKQKQKREEDRWLKDLAWHEQRKAQQDLDDQEKEHEEWKHQNTENERLGQLKKKQREADLREAQALQEVYIRTEEANDRRREKALEDRSAAVMAKMNRFSTKGAGKQESELEREIEARANAEQQRRNKMKDADEKRRVREAERRLSENNKVVARQVEERRIKRALEHQQQQEQARKFTCDEEEARAERERNETSRRKTSQLQQKKWLAAQVNEKREKANGVLELTDMTMTELKLNKQLLAATVSRTAHLKNKAKLQQVITGAEPDAGSKHRRARTQAKTQKENSALTTRPW